MNKETIIKGRNQSLRFIGEMFEEHKDFIVPIKLLKKAAYLNQYLLDLDVFVTGSGTIQFKKESLNPSIYLEIEIGIKGIHILFKTENRTDDVVLLYQKHSNSSIEKELEYYKDKFFITN